jgi:hypothetical protein
VTAQRAGALRARVTPVFTRRPPTAPAPPPQTGGQPGKPANKPVMAAPAKATGARPSVPPLAAMPPRHTINGGAAGLPTTYSRPGGRHVGPGDGRARVDHDRSLREGAQPAAAPAPPAQRWQQRMNDSNRRYGGSGGGGTVAGAGYDIDSMRSGWDPALARAKAAHEAFLAEMRAFAAAVAETPVHGSVHDAAMQLVASVGPVADRVDALHGLTHQADRETWDRLIDNPRPNDPKWTNG